MEKEILITGDDREEWTNEVNKYLSEGWKVREHTLKMCIRNTPLSTNVYAETYTIECFTIVLYKYENIRY